MIYDYISILIGIIKILVFKLIYRNRIFINGIAKVNDSFRLSLKKGTLLRIGNKFKARNNTSIRNDYCGKICIGDNVFFNDNVSLNCQKEIIIGNNVNIGHNVIIIDHDHDYRNDMKNFIGKKIIIGDNVWIGANAIILKGCIIPSNTIIAAGTVLKEKDTHNLVSSMLIHNDIKIKYKEVN